MATAPQNIVITDDFHVWLADAGTAVPDFGDDERADPPAGWAALATGLRISEDGLTVTFSRTVEEIMTIQGRQAIKAVNTTEQVMVMFDSCKFDLESLAQNLLGSAAEAVATTAPGSGEAGFKTLELDHGLDVKRYALFCQFGFTPEPIGLKGDFYMPFCYQSADPAPVFSKSDAAKLAFEFKQLSSDGAPEKPLFRFADALAT